MAKTDSIARILALASMNGNGGSAGSGEGTKNYLELLNKPKINGVELKGNKTLADLGIVFEVDSTLSASSENAISNKVVKEALDAKADSADVYNKSEIDGLMANTISKSDAIDGGTF